MSNFLKKVIADLRLELADEFDQNFERKAFFNEPWKAKQFSNSTESLLVDSGRLRRSIVTRANATGLTFESDTEYANTHNSGAEITVTARMKQYFRFKYWSLKDSNSSLAGYYLNMSRKSVGSKIVVPQRQFIGEHPEVDRIIDEITAHHIEEIMNYEFAKFNN